MKISLLFLLICVAAATATEVEQPEQDVAQTIETSFDDWEPVSEQEYNEDDEEIPAEDDDELNEGFSKKRPSWRLSNLRRRRRRRRIRLIKPEDFSRFTSRRSNLRVLGRILSGRRLDLRFGRYFCRRYGRRYGRYFCRRFGRFIYRENLRRKYVG